MTSLFSASVLVFAGTTGIWGLIFLAALILLCPAAMYFGMRGMRNRRDAVSKTDGDFRNKDDADQRRSA